MAKYSNVKKPAFFIPWTDYLQSIGNIIYQDNNLNDIHILNPAKTHTIKPEDDWWVDGQIEHRIDFNKTSWYSAISDLDDYIYIFILGHNFGHSQCAIDIEFRDDNVDGVEVWKQTTIRESVINDLGANSPPDRNGFSIFKAKWPNWNVQGMKIIIRGFDSASNSDIKVGSVSMCTKWTAPHNPDLSIKMSKEYDGVKTLTTKGGATLSNASYTRGGTYWVNSYPWEIPYGVGSGSSDYPSTNGYIARERTLGRRVWDMNFSYLSDSDIMPEFESMWIYGTEYTDAYNKNILDSHSFFARVLNRVQGSHLPFIFLPNDENTNPDQWAIARFDQKKFDIMQSAPNLYNLKLNIRESW